MNFFRFDNLSNEYDVILSTQNSDSSGRKFDIISTCFENRNEFCEDSHQV